MIPPDDVAAVIPAGRCQCGCNLPTRVVTKTNAREGVVPGMYRQFVRGHQARVNGIIPQVQDTLARRLFTRVVIDPVTGCWNWTGHLNHDGYGGIRVSKGHDRHAHIVTYEMFVGPVPPGYELHHAVCENKACCNFEHVTPLTKSEHSKLNPIVCRQLEQTHCKRGHPLSGDNLSPHYLARGVRRCLTCDRERNARVQKTRVR